MPFEKGVSGNPGGRPAVLAKVRALAQDHSEAVILRLVELSKDADGRVAVAACNAILDRALGKPTVAVEVDARVTTDPRELLAGLLGRVATRDPAGGVAGQPEPGGG
jgi:hypothetical protein